MNCLISGFECEHEDREKSMNNCLKLFIVLVAALLAAPCLAGSTSTLTLYDNFNVSYINPTKWIGQEHESSSTYPVLRDTLREIDSNQLHLRAYAWTGQFGSDAYEYGQNRLNALNLSSATALQANVMVKAVQTNGVTDNTQAAVARARILGYFFNNIKSPGYSDSDYTGDVFAYVGLARSSSDTTASNVLTVVAAVMQCGDTQCTAENQTTLASDKTHLGTVKLGQTATLSLQWNATDKQFSVASTVGKTKKSYTLTPTGVNYTNSPVDTTKRLDIICTVPDSASQELTMMDAYFDNLYYQ